MPRKKAPFLRFMESYTICKDTGCWLWNSSKYKNGYGWLKAFGKVVSAHRFSYELYNGAIPGSYQILHSCDVKACVNPEHLRAGSHAENMLEAAQRGLMRSGSSHPRFGIKNPRPSQANKVHVLGSEYESQKAAERALGLGSGTVRYWIKNSPNKAWILKD